MLTSGLYMHVYMCVHTGTPMYIHTSTLKMIHLKKTLASDKVEFAWEKKLYSIFSLH